MKDRAAGTSVRPIPEGRACGKVILLGEHAVVYGVPALAVGIDRGASAHASPLPEGPSRLRVGGWEIELSEDDTTRDLARAFAAVLAVTRDAHARAGRPPVGPVFVEARADLPPGGGLGCSAAMGVAVARAIDPTITDADAAERAMAWERIFHGNPSGVDAAVSASGGCVLFEKGKPLEPIQIHGGLTLCIGHTGIASSTKTMVDAVAKLRARRPEVVEKAFEGIRALVRNARLALEAGDRFALGRLLDLNQMILSGLMVSTAEVETLCSLARAAGAAGAKLTGAGGGGCVVALVNTNATADAVLAAWKAEGYEGFTTTVTSQAPPLVRLTQAVP